MPEPTKKVKVIKDPIFIVEKVPGGYRVSNYADGVLTAVNDKVYFHPTSAYAAMGRLIHAGLVSRLSLAADPAKAPAKEGK